MNEFLLALKKEFTKHERKTRPESKEKTFKPLYDIALRTESIEKLTNQLVELTNKLIVKHSIEVTDSLKSKITDLVTATVQKRLLN